MRAGTSIWENTIPSFRHVSIIFLAASLLLAPAFILGAGGWDLHCQSITVKLFSQAFWSGDIYPRWLPEMFAGDGAPAFFYYPPFTYFITALFDLLSPLDAFGYYPIAASAFLGLFISGITCYVWLREETDNPTSALIGSLLYIAAPVTLAQNFYYLLLFSSVWAYAWLPLLMLCAKRLALTRPYAVPAFAVTLALLFMTNIPMTIIGAPLAVAYCLLYFTKQNWHRQGLLLAVAITFGFGLAAIYLLPSYAYMGYASLDLQWTRAKMVREPFITSLKGMVRTHLEAYLFFSFILAISYYRINPRTKLNKFLLAATLGALFMMTPFSEGVWDMFPILYVVQMSERFFVITSLCLALLAALTLPRLRSLAFLLLAVYSVVTYGVAYKTRVTPENFEASEPGLYYAWTLNVDQYAMYLPNTGLMSRFGTPEGLKQVMSNREQVTVPHGTAQVEVLQWKPRAITMRYHASTASTLQVRQFNYPGWRAFLRGEDLQLRRDDPTGEILFDVPAGQGEIELKLTKLVPEVAGKMISMVSALLLVLMGLLEMKRRKQFAYPTS